MAQPERPERPETLWDVLSDPRYGKSMWDGQKREREPLPDGLRRSVLRRDRFTCCNCRDAWSPGSDIYLQVDHVLPIAGGGTDRSDNLQTLCEPCNWDKRDRLTLAVVAARPRLIVTSCYTCGDPQEDDRLEATSRVFCATCKALRSLHPLDAEYLELAKYLGRV